MKGKKESKTVVQEAWIKELVLKNPAKYLLIDDIVSKHKNMEGSLLPILHDIQFEFGCVEDETKRYLANVLNLTRAEIQGIVSFYHDFANAPSPLPIIKLCGAEACQARGYRKLRDEIGVVANGRCQIETVYCLGLCSAGPSAMIGSDVHAQLNTEKLRHLIEAL
ncbi:NAD(P)H-dependent oxidoreductase subunit E [Parasphingorhabdus cellanae]|uniref:NAD(P)H-dependent oxidoreductase subunit E n=1 Tax=Parasphingorhabdus cellanae TaxID=2806553 RepID=A0ABX7T6K3_9SPHN|nr:NAD(P)H-dependent oxidoreductase subunit E [Parasphingorhabdus cellanae]QTD55845.1 NAD(P)H-dependent oxidoreductase subunit E [Parasphingorhabdus cellanae]